MNDLDLIVKGLDNDNLTLRQAQEALLIEFQRKDRFWPTLYLSFERFKSQADACLNYLLIGPTPGKGIRKTPESIPDREPSDEIKEQVKRRDHHRCRRCGETSKRLLQIDHLASWYHGGRNTPDNLLTLCRTCNLTKGVSEMNFMISRNELKREAPLSFPVLEMPEGVKAKDRAEWEKFLRRTLNLFFHCAAISEVRIGGRGRGFHEWEVELCDGNNSTWLAFHLKPLVTRIRQKISEARSDGSIMQRLTIRAPGVKPVSWPRPSRW